MSLALAACGPAYVVQAGGLRPLAVDPLPPLVVTTPGQILRTTATERLAAARPSSRLPLEVVRSSQDGSEALVHLRGGIDVLAVARLQDLGVLVCQPGPLTERVYLGAGNLVTLRSGVHPGTADAQGPQVDVHVQVALPGREGRYGPAIAHQTLEASLPVARLCAALPPPRHAGTHADPWLAHGLGEVDPEDFPPGLPTIDFPKDVTLTLQDRPAPDAAVIFTRPATSWGFEVVRLQHQGDWDLVAVGGGPYLTGWMSARPVRGPEPMGGLGALIGGASNGPFSLHVAALRTLPLHHLPAGTVIQQRGKPFARLDKPGFARVGTQRDGWVYVTAAVDDDVVVEGWTDPKQVGDPVR